MATKNSSPKSARCALALAISLAFAAPVVDAAGLGRLTVYSALGQPLRAEVEVTSVTSQEAASLAVRLASASAFRQANLEFNPALSSLRFALDKRGDNRFVVRVSSASAVNEPFLDLLLELNSSTGRVLREYTVLLDPPALKTAPEVVAPVARAPAPAPEAAPAPVAPPAAAAAPAPAAPATRASVTSASTYAVQRGDTLGKIAQQTKPPAASLDQMLVSLFRANPDAFVSKNMNILRAGSTLRIPAESETLATGVADSRREVAAQSADFSQYRSRLAQAAGTTAPSAPAAAGQGRVTTKVEDKGAPARTGDQLKIAKADATAPGQVAATKAADEAVARDRQLKELQQRVAELEQTNQKLQQALELQSKAGATAQKAAETKTGAAAPTPAPAPVAAPTPPPETAAKAPTPAETPKVEPAKAEPPKAEAPRAEAPKAEAPKPAPAKAAPAEEPGFLQSLFADTSGYAIGGLAAAVVALLGFAAYRRRKSADQKGDLEMAEGLRGNSLFGQTGGQSVDTAATSTFNSSFIPSSSQLDSNEVDPVAEADVYIAYGREEQAEEILKEALRLQPDRHPARSKLLEIYSRRGDKASFNAVAQELKERTGAMGDEWERAVKLGRALDPGNALYGAAGTAAEMATRGPTTELRLTPGTTIGAGATSAMAPMPAMSAAELEQASTIPVTEMPSLEFGKSTVNKPAPETVLSKAAIEEKLQDTYQQNDSRLGVETRLPVEPTEAPSIPVSPVKTDLSDAPTQLAGLDFELEAPLTTLKRETPAKSETPAVPAFDMNFEPPKTLPIAKLPSLPDLDLDLPGKKSKPAPSFTSPPTETALARGTTRPSATIPGFDDTLSRPSLIGEVGALPEERAPRLLSNTDQATVPLIDFDLSGADVELGGRRTETPTGSPLAAQMSTKLDLARGYIDLGVKDGARELLEEVMRDGTREQRQSAVELMKQIEG